MPTSSSSSSKKANVTLNRNVQHPTLRKEGKAQNLHIQMKPSTKKPISKSQLRKLKNVFPKMSTMMKPLPVIQPKKTTHQAILIEPGIVNGEPTAQVQTAYVEEDEESEEEEESEDEENSKPPSKISHTQNDEEEEDEDEDEDDEGDDKDEDENEEDEEEEEEEEENELKLKEGANVPGSLHTQYPGDFRVPDVYHTSSSSSANQEPKTSKPKVAAPIASTTVNPKLPSDLTPGKERALKQIILYKMGMVTPEDKKEEYAKLYTVKNSLAELQDVYNQLKVAASMTKSINWSKQICNLAVQGIETFMMKQKVVDLSLMEGWGQNTTLMLEDGEFDDMLSEMVGGSAADYHPLTRIGLTLFFGGVGYYFTQKATRKHVGAPSSSFVNPMTSFMNAQAAAAAPHGGGMGGASVNAPPAGSFPMPWYPSPPSHVPSQQSQQPHQQHHAQQQQQPHQPIHREQTSASEMQQKVIEREQARQQQSRESMLQSQSSPPDSKVSGKTNVLPELVIPQTPSISSMNNAASRYTADKIKDYHHQSPFKRRRSPVVKDCDSDSDDSESGSESGSKSRSGSSGADDSEEEDEEEEESDVEPLPKRSKPNGGEGKTKTASMLGSATLQAKIDKALALQKQGRPATTTIEQEPARASAIGIAAIPVTASSTAYVPLKRQTVDGPPPPMNPRGGEQMSMFGSESINAAELVPLSSTISVI